MEKINFLNSKKIAFSSLSLDNPKKTLNEYKINQQDKSQFTLSPFNIFENQRKQTNIKQKKENLASRSISPLYTAGQSKNLGLLKELQEKKEEQITKIIQDYRKKTTLLNATNPQEKSSKNSLALVNQFENKMNLIQKKYDQYFKQLQQDKSFLDNKSSNTATITSLKINDLKNQTLEQREYLIKKEASKTALLISKNQQDRIQQKGAESFLSHKFTPEDLLKFFQKK